MNTQISKRLYEEHDGFALRQLKSRAFTSVWKNHIDEIIEIEVRKDIKIQEARKRQS